MTIKILIYLWLVALMSAEEQAKTEHKPLVAYSSVYTSFGSHIDEKDDKHEEAKTSAPVTDEISDKSAPVQEGITIHEEIKPAEIPIENNSAKATEQKVNQGSIIYSIPNVQTAAPVESQTLDPKAVTPDPILTSATNPPFSPTYVAKGRLITPGLSAFASSGEVIEDEPVKITIVDAPNSKKISEPSTESAVSKTQESKKESKDTKPDLKTSDGESESHTSFHDSATSYSW